MRETKFSILKAIAIICVVLSHAGISGWLFNFVFIFHVPIFLSVQVISLIPNT